MSFSLVVTAQQEEERENLTPASFKTLVREITEVKGGVPSDSNLDYYQAADEDGEAALAYLTGLLHRERGDFDSAKESFRSARDILDSLSKKKDFKSAYPYTEKDVSKELAGLINDDYLLKPLADKKVIENSLKSKKQLQLVFSNGRPYAEVEGSYTRYRIDSVASFCKQARSIYPKQIYKFQGKTLKIEYMKASNGSEVIYDYCHQKMATDMAKRQRERDIPEEEDPTPGWSTRKSAHPLSVVGPLFSYSVFDELTESRVSYTLSVHTYDLSRQKPAKFSDWFESKSLNLPCPKEAPIGDGLNLHCSPEAEIKRDQFSIAGFRKDFATADLKVYVQNFHYGEADYYTQSEGTAKPKARLRRLLKASNKEFLFDTSKEQL